jgi:DNA replication protein DnaC
MVKEYESSPALVEARRRWAELCDRHPRKLGWTIDNYRTDPASIAALDALEEAGWFYNGGKVYLWGPVGSGKTRLAWSLLRDGLEDTVNWGGFVNIRDLLAATRDYYTHGGDDPLQGLDNFDYLVLDDMGAERCTEWSRDAIATLVERRCEGFVSTIVTSNYSPSQLVTRFDPRDLIIGQRIVSRLVEDCIVVKVDGPDRRLRAA